MDEPRHQEPQHHREPTVERRGRWRLVLPWLLLAIGVFLSLAVGFAIYQWATWPDVAVLATSNPETTAFIEDYRQRPEGRGGPDWRWVPYRRIAVSLKLAILVSEDIEFFDHHGFSRDEIEAALRGALKEGKPLRGASTLTQQLAKNLWLSPSRNPWRKIKEAMLTRQLERRLTKRRILELYLNVAEFGPGVFGAEAAARRYFGTSAADLTAEQAAELAAGLPNPAAWHPGTSSRTARRRMQRILGRMEEAEWLEDLL